MRRALDVNFRNLALGHEVFDADGATFVRDRNFPAIYDANFVFDVKASAPDEIDRLLGRVRSEYNYAARWTFRVDPFSPPEFEARLALDGYKHTEALVLILEGSLRGQPKRLDIRLVDDEPTWTGYTNLKILDWQEHAASFGGNVEDLGVPHGLARCSRLKYPQVQYVLAYINGQAVGHCNAWEGRKGIGQVEDLFVHPSHRHRGVATALLHFCVAAARARGAGPVTIVANVENTSKAMYATLGWRPLTVCREYWVDVDPRTEN